MSKIGTYQQQPAGYKAFIPAPFPAAGLVTWDNDLIMLLSQADRAIGSGRPSFFPDFLLVSRVSSRIRE